VKTNLNRQINRAVNFILCTALFPLVAMYSGVHYATKNDVKTKGATTNECYNERMLQRKNATTNECYNERMLQRTNAETKNFYQ